MKAALLTKPAAIAERPLRIEDVAQPGHSSGQVLLKVRACGVCRTDLHITEGELPQRRRPLIPGHQIVGEVIAGATQELPPGTRVGVSWVGGIDGTCWYCRHDKENLCDAPTFTGYTVDGGYAEFATARADFIFPLPSSLDDSSALARPRISPSKFSMHGNARSTFQREESPTGNSLKPLARNGWERKPTSLPANSTARLRLRPAATLWLLR